MIAGHLVNFDFYAGSRDLDAILALNRCDTAPCRGVPLADE